MIEAIIRALIMFISLYILSGLIVTIIASVYFGSGKEEIIKFWKTMFFSFWPVTIIVVLAGWYTMRNMKEEITEEPEE